MCEIGEARNSIKFYKLRVDTLQKNLDILFKEIQSLKENQQKIILDKLNEKE